MTDEPRPPDQAPNRPGDAGADAGRDPEIAAALEVPALDETTRRRLVRTAADAADELPAGAAPRSVSRMGAAIGVAAVLLVGAVVGAVVVTRPDDPQTPTAARAPSTSPTTAAVGGAPAPQSAEDQDAASVSSGPPEQLGDLGTAVGEEGLRQALDSGFAKATAERSTAAAEAVPCSGGDPSVVGLAVVTAEATAVLDRQAVSVLVGTTPDGQREAVVVDPARCEVVQRVAL